MDKLTLMKEQNKTSMMVTAKIWAKDYLKKNEIEFHQTFVCFLSFLILYSFFFFKC